MGTSAPVSKRQKKAGSTTMVEERATAATKEETTSPNRDQHREESYVGTTARETQGAQGEAKAPEANVDMPGYVFVSEKADLGATPHRGRYRRTAQFQF